MVGKYGMSTYKCPFPKVVWFMARCMANRLQEVQDRLVFLTLDIP